MFAACISWARSSSTRLPSSLMERSNESRPPSPPWWYDTATSTWDSGIFRLRACSRIVIAVHAASEALSNYRPRRRAAPAVGAADREHRCPGTAVERASAIKVTGHHSLWAGSAIVVRTRHRAFLLDHAWPVRADRGS